MAYKKLAIVGTGTLLNMAKLLKERGEITEENYREMEKRNNKLNNIEREDVIIEEVN